VKSQRTSDFYRDLWSALVAELEGVLAAELVRHWEAVPRLQTVRQAWREDVTSWVEVAHRRLDHWRRGRAKRQSIRFDALLALPSLVNDAPLGNLFPLLASYSFFRLLPYRRSLVWDQHTNKVVPQSFLDDFVIGHTAGLSFGETAFAAFASDFAPHTHGMVVADGFRNLRGTFSLTDRILGLRSNAFIPLRAPSKRTELGSLLGIAVVSLPIPAVLPTSIIETLSQCTRKYTELLLLLLKSEQGEERAELEKAMVDPDNYGLGSLCRTIVTQPISVHGRRGQSERSAPLPFCATIQCAVSGSPTNKVLAQTANVYIARDAEDEHLSTEAELSRYGLGQRTAALDLTEFPTATRGLYLVDSNGRSPKLSNRAQQFLRNLPKLAARVSQELEDASIPDSPVHGHLQTEILRDLSRRIMAVILEGRHSGARSDLFDLLTLLSPQPLKWQGAIDDLCRIGRQFAATSDTIAFCWCRDIAALKIPLPDASYVDAFSLVAADKRSVRLPEIVGSRNSAYEIGHAFLAEVNDSHGFLAWARAVMQLADCTPEGTSVTFRAADGFDLISAADPRNRFVFSSLVMRRGARLEVARHAGEVTLSIRWNSCRLVSSWVLRRELFPMTLHRTSDGPKRILINQEVSGEWCKNELLYGDVSKCGEMAPRRETNDTPALIGMPAQKRVVMAVAELFTRLKCLPALIDTLAIVPLANGGGSRPETLFTWASIQGSRVLLLLGSFRRTTGDIVGRTRLPAPYVLRCYGSNVASVDPLMTRFYSLTEAVYKWTRQRSDRRVQAYRAATGGHILHELRGDMTALEKAVAQPQSPDLRMSAERTIARFKDLIRSDMGRGIPPVQIGFDHLLDALNPGILDARRRVIERQNGKKQPLSSLAGPRLQELLPLQPIDRAEAPLPDVVDLLSNLFGNAAESAIRNGGDLRITISDSAIHVENTCCVDDLHGVLDVVNGRTPPVAGRGLSQIVSLTRIFGLQILARKGTRRRAGTHSLILSMSID
jgi:hypothetical protein